MPHAQTAMLKCLVTYYENAIKTVEAGDINWSKIREVTSDVWYRLTQMKFEDPATGEGEFSAAHCCQARAIVLPLRLKAKDSAVSRAEE